MPKVVTKIAPKPKARPLFYPNEITSIVFASKSAVREQYIIDKIS